MRDPGNQSGSIASALKGLFSGIKNGRTRFLAYGFVFAFVACTAFLAFCPSGSASPWFNRNFFSTSSISSSKDSNRSQVSSLFSYIFSNSSSGSSRDHLNSIASQWHGQVGVLPMVNRTEMGVGSRGDGISGDGRVEKGVGSLKDGVLGKNQTEVGVGLHGNGVSGKNLTEDRIGSRENGVSAENKTEGGVGSEKDRVLARKNQTVSGIGSLGSVVPVRNQTEEGVLAAKNQTGIGIASQENGVLVNNQTEVTVGSKESVVVPVNNQTEKGVGTHKNGVFAKNQTGETPAITKHNSNFTASPMKPNGPAASLSNSDYSKREESINSLMNCDIFQGRWVRDKSYPLYPAGSCPHIDEAFNCYLNGRPDRAYQKLRWQPNGCNIPRLNATDMLERLRGKRLVFVGDSLNRNMWQSLVCVLRNSVKDKKKVFEASGNRQFRTEGFYSFLFKDYNCAIEFFPAPFLVQEWEIQGPKGKRKETLRLDVIERSSSKYKDANVIVFNTGHWWTHEKTSKGKDYYQEGNHVYSELKVDKAFHKALSTWAKWVDANLNPKKTLVFFRGYSATHFSGGRWNSGGKCNGETEPIKNETYLSSYPPKMSILETVLKGMRTPVSYLNITRMTDYRKDAHPSIYRKQRPSEEERRSPERYQDCSHWCLPGLPDSWNELLYTQLLIKQH